MRSSIRLLALFLLAVLSVWGAVPRVTGVEPPFGQNGEELVVQGENLDSATVEKMFLTGGGEDHDVEIKEQTPDSIRFVIPADLALGRYNVTLQTQPPTPAILEQPVACSVVNEEDAREMAKSRNREVEIVEQNAPAQEEQPKR